MICETCKTEGKTSRVFELGGRTTAMSFQPFYDEQGRRHVHDGNTRTSAYKCSNGHVWETNRKGSCWCGWPSQEGSGEHG